MTVRSGAHWGNEAQKTTSRLRRWRWSGDKRGSRNASGGDSIHKVTISDVTTRGDRFRTIQPLKQSQPHRLAPASASQCSADVSDYGLCPFDHPLSNAMSHRFYQQLSSHDMAVKRKPPLSVGGHEIISRLAALTGEPASGWLSFGTARRKGR